ncbi:MAG: hypothetical protein V4580_15190 [Bacteroidota bacterium]
MRYIYGFVAICLVSTLTFCTGEKQAVNENTKSNNMAKLLSEDAMYDIDSIVDGLKVVTELQKNEGRKYFLRAMDLLVNEKKATESIVLFKEAIRYFPDGRMFMFLTKAYIELNDVDNASLVNEVCLRVGYSPYHEMVFNDALIYAIKKDTVNCIDNLYQAIREGFLNKDKIINEKHFDFVRDDERYASLMVNTFGDNEKLQALMFRNYLKDMPNLNLPFTESIDSVSNRLNGRYINYDYAVFIPDMEDGRFSRDVTNEYMYIGKIKLDSNCYAVVYKTFFAIADTLNPTKTYVITYDSVGNIIDNEIVGCFCSPTTSQAFTISTDMTIESSEYTYKWKNDPIEKGYAGNKIESFEVAKAKQIQLGGSGTIKRISIAGNTTVKSAKEGG